ncbi:MAG: putative ATPase [Comamonadaceae bacterium]|nr:MAG: putative ATPase [Comamonadaceae bacterium]
MDVALCEQWLKERLPGKATRHLGLQAAQVGVWNHQWVNASEDLLALAQGIQRCGSARILLYGPPGSGKTAYAHALAQMLDRPLLEQRASDLLSPYVGETEQRINQAFEQALDDQALLFLDEADSLLARREHAVRNWEVSQVNELLEQLGDFAGVVVLASNRMEALDEAVLRRLDAKIEFLALNAFQAQQCFVGLCQHLGFEFTPEDLQMLAGLKPLTPGDFACVARRLAFAPLATETTASPVSAPTAAAAPDRMPPPHRTPSQTLLELLAQELRFKSGGRRRMGFLAEPCGSGVEGSTSAFQ